MSAQAESTISHQHLQIFVTVVEKRSFSRAAKDLHLTQPAITLHIQALERDVGARLLERTNRFVRLTKAGEIVFDHATRILSIQAQMRRCLDDLLREASGPLSIGASFTFGEYALPYLLAIFCARHPQVRPSVMIANTGQIAELVASNRLDIGLVEGEVSLPHVLSEPVSEDTLVVVAPPTFPLAPILSNPTIEPNALASVRWIVREQGSGTRAATDRFFAQAGLSVTDTLELGSTQMIKEAVEAGLGCALLSRWTIRKELALGALRELQVTGLPITRQLSMLTLTTTFRTKALDEFADFMRGEAREQLQRRR
jgi:DNA-binding transcriptional LysR family regulator